jgi:hypothetical protein
MLKQENLEFIKLGKIACSKLFGPWKMNGLLAPLCL